LLLSATAAAANPFPWKAGDKPPTIGGLALGDARRHVTEVLGIPDEMNPTSNGDVFEYASKGLEVTIAPDGVSAIRMHAPEAGSLGDLKVGDKARDVLMKWGAPQGGEGRIATFGTRDWMISVRLADKDPIITEMTLASLHAKPVPPPNSGDINVFKTQ
jgi:hypothetical protein